MNIEIAYQIEKMKKEGLYDPEVAERLGLDVRDVFHTRRALGISSLPGGGSNRIRVRIYDRNGNFVMEGTRREVGERLNYAKSTVASWERAQNPPYRVERVEEVSA